MKDYVSQCMLSEEATAEQEKAPRPAKFFSVIRKSNSICFYLLFIQNIFRSIKETKSSVSFAPLLKRFANFELVPQLL